MEKQKDSIVRDSYNWIQQVLNRFLSGEDLERALTTMESVSVGEFYKHYKEDIRNAYIEGKIELSDLTMLFLAGGQLASLIKDPIQRANDLIHINYFAHLTEGIGLERQRNNRVKMTKQEES